MRGRYDETPVVAPALPPRVLVVDDEPANVRLVQAYLHADGFRTLAAENGAEALERVAEGGVDLVLLDIRMPHMDGFEVCRRLRKNPAYGRIPVVFLTAEFNDPDSELMGLEVGADEFLSKPIQRRTLVARVRNLIRLADAERDRRLVAQVAQSEKLAALGQIAAGVAHEINNPLAFILSNLSSLHGYLADLRKVVEAYRESPEAGAACEASLGFEAALADLGSLLHETAQGGERVRSIVQELKTFSGADELGGLETVDLAEIATSTLLLTEQELTAHARLVKDLKPAPVSRAPRGKLHQVAMHLILNALQALEVRPGQVNEIRVTTGLEGADAVLTVSDTGVGIPLGQQSRIFEPFYTTKPVGAGTGIGLFVCAAVVEKLGGSIRVESSPARGTMFSVRIPSEDRAGSGPREGAGGEVSFAL